MPDHYPGTRYEAGCAGWLAQGLVHVYRALGYEPAAEMARGLMEHIAFRSGFFGADGTFGPDKLMEPELERHIDRLFVYTPQTAVYFRTHTNQTMAMLDYIEATGDTTMLPPARGAYAYGKSRGQRLAGYLPEYLDARPCAETAETCQIADMIVSALMLARLGVDSCWDDVDRWVRNQFAENQMIRSGWVYRMAEQLPHCAVPDSPTVSTDRVAERHVGSFAGWPSPNDFLSWDRREIQHLCCGVMHCCTGNGARALYYVWHDILTYDAGRLQVNLLLNRASPWADVDSHIPYTGQVDVRLKQPLREVAVRIPERVQPSEVRCTVVGQDRSLGWEGRYALCGEAAPGQVVTLTFPIAEKSGHIWIEKTRCNMVVKGYEVEGPVLGIIGFGSSGQEMARRARPFGMRIQAIDVRPIEPAVLDEIQPEFMGCPDDIDQVVQASDFLSLHLHLNAETRHLLDARRIALMKPSACLLNVARGGLVDEAALHEALMDNRIAGAGLDVFGQEPADPTLPVYRLPNVVVTPHVSGGTDGTARKRAAAAAENLKRLAQGLEPLYRVDL